MRASESSAATTDAVDVGVEVEVEVDANIDAATREAVVAALCARLRGNYVFPTIGEAMAAHIETRDAAGAYAARGGQTLADMLTDDMREISNDLHLRVRYRAQPRPRYIEDDIGQNADRYAEYGRDAARRNYGFERVERLPGNIGYLEQRALDDARLASETALAALRLLAPTDALILDLRRNGGGDPRLVALLCSALLPSEPTHLNTFYARDDNSFEQFWTLPWLPVPRYLDKPVYVLTSRRTASGAEELAYNLQTLKRATLIGETTAGAAHPVRLHQLSPHFEANIAFGRAINPVTGANWEGVGVVPDIALPAEHAFAHAQQLALRHALALADADPEREELAREARAALEQLEEHR
jgi:hypothetical protein